MIDLVVGGLVVRIDAEAAGREALEGALASRWERFVAPAGATPGCLLRIAATTTFDAGYHLNRPDAALRITAARDNSRGATANHKNNGHFDRSGGGPA